MNGQSLRGSVMLFTALAWAGCGDGEIPTTSDPARDLPQAARAASGGSRVLVGFAGEPDPAVVSALGGTVRYTYDLVPAVAASVPEAVIDALRTQPGVAYVEPDAEVRGVDAELDDSWGVKRIGAGAVHDGGIRGTGIRVAILDTGIDYAHPDLDGSYAGGHDFVNGDPDPMDDNGHGTQVAGILGAEDDGVGVVGVAPAARLFALKVLDGSGDGFASDVIAALEWCVDHGIQVTNNSYGALVFLETITLEQAFDNAAAAGVLHVAAAGNSGNLLGVGDNVMFPARYASVIAVGATDRIDQRASFSSTGLDVELAAPGAGVPSTQAAIRGGGYSTGSGTSFASPHAAGAAALAIAAGIPGAQVRQRLQETADDLGLPGKDPQYGFGLVDADGAVAAEAGVLVP